MARPPVLSITSARQWRVLISPARAEIAQALRFAGPCSIAELAALLHRPADRLYRHIELLQQAGFIIHAGDRKRGRHHEQLIDVAADDFALDVSDPDGTVQSAILAETSRAFLRATDRAVGDAAIARELLLQPDARRNFFLNYEVGWLTPEKFRQVRGLIQKIKLIVEQGNRSREGQLYVSLSVAVPLRRRGRSGPSGHPAEHADPVDAPSKPVTATNRRRATRVRRTGGSATPKQGRRR